MIDKVSRYVLYPFFMAAYPIIFLLSMNLGQLPIQQAGRILLISLLVALVLTLLLGVITRDFRRGGFLTFVLLALFFSYRHVYNFLEGNIPSLGNQVFLNATWAVLLLAGIWGAYKIRSIDTAAKYLNLVVLFLLIQPTASVGLFVYRFGVQDEDVDPFNFKKTNASSNLPDIYYIILDGHGRSDVLQELYDYDNTPFIDYLRQRGFYVAEQSRSNYAQTAQSLASSLNFNYLDPTKVDPQSSDRSQLARWVKRNEVKRFLKEQGYTTVAFSTGYDLTTLQLSDVFIPLQDASGLNSFEHLVFSMSVMSALDPETQGKIFVDPFQCENYRRYVLNIFNNLEKVPDIPGPKYVFVHIVSPHPPFVLGSAENNAQNKTCLMSDGDNYSGDDLVYKKGYSDQAAYIDSLMQKTVEIILEKSDVPPVIIIQGDHGPGLLLDWRSSENSCLRERFSILNAYYIPSASNDQLYETITPVNSFRVVLNEVFNSQLPLLEDKNYYSTLRYPYQFEDITGKIETSCK